MKKQITGIVIFLCAAGCNNGGGGGGGGGDSALSLSDQPLGNYAADSQLPSNDMSRYSVGCQQQGQPGEVAQVDSRLQPGMDFVTAFVFATPDKTASGVIENVIQSVSDKTLVESMKIIKISGVPGIQAGFTSTVTCTLDSGGHFPCTYNPDPGGAQTPQPNCNINVTSSSPEQKFIGRFTTVAGRPFKAYKIVDHMSGDLTCNGSAAGPGTLDFVEIVSNEVPSEGSASFCGGVYLWNYFALKKSDGTLIYGGATERTTVK